MTLIPYNNNNSLSRFSSNKNWIKILFKSDRKLQTTEVEELQELLIYQTTRAYSTLYNFYTIIKGCQVIILSISNTSYSCLLTEGQIFLETKNKQGYFIDTPAHSFTVSRTQSTDVGIIFNFFKFVDEDILRNPHTGGASFGSAGSNRLVLTPEIIISPKDNPYGNGFYPIAIIKPKTLSFVLQHNDLSDSYPEIIYYRNEELTTLYNEKNLSTYIKSLVELRIKESSGDFIATGLDCFINSKTNTLCISPGVAYINGKRIETNYNNYFQLDPNEINNQNIILNKQYLFYLTYQGQFDFIEQSNLENNLAETPPNCLALCYLVLNHRDNLLLNYSLIEAPTRMPKVNELLNLNLINQSNIKELAELILSVDLLNLSSNNINEKLNGIFTDSFNDLNNSDIFFPGYEASILPSIQAISLPFSTTHKSNRNFTIDQSTSSITVENILNENNELVPYWSTIQGNQIKLFKSPLNITNSVTIPFTNNNIIVQASPSTIYKTDLSTFVNYTHPDIKYLTGLNTAPIIDTPLNNTIYVRNITIRSFGFPSNQDNIKVQINNLVINTFSVIKGSSGSINGTLKANVSGELNFTFGLPSINYNDTITISLNYLNIEGTVTVKIIDPEIEKINRENNASFIEQKQTKYPVLNSGIAQVFQITEPSMLTGVECVIIDYPRIQEGSIINIQLAAVDSIGVPIESLGTGSINIANITPLSQERAIPASTNIMFDKPINVKRGRYAIIFSTVLPNIKLGATKASNNRLLDGKTFYYDPFKLEVLHYTTQWELLKTADNIACDLIASKPISLLSSTIINIENSSEDTFDILDINLSTENDTNSYYNVFVLNENQQYDLVQNGSYFFKTSVASTKVRIDLQGTTSTHPILNLEDISINLLKSKPKAVWISKNQEYDSAYTNLVLSLDVYKPDNASFKFYFSSNKGNTWEELTDPTLELINSSLPLYKYTFSKNNLSFITFNNQSTQRFNLRYKIEIEMNNLDGIYPFFKNLISITNP